MNDIKELKDEELEKVNGGFTANADGTYSFKAGDAFRQNLHSRGNKYEVMRDYENVTPDTKIECWHYEIDANDNLISEDGWCLEYVSVLLEYHKI